MFILNDELKLKIIQRLKENISFCSIDKMYFEEVCSCKGGCGTYTPPCSCCAYDD